MNERLQEIKDSFEWGKENLEEGLFNLTDEQIEWLIEQAEKVEQLQQENEQLNKALDGAEKYLINNGRKIMELTDQLEQAQAKAERLESTITETLELLKRGGVGTRSKVQFKLEQVCNELEGDAQ
jgi:multidrug resistance efflux pump